MKRIDLTGKRFNRWTVLYLDKEKSTKHLSMWVCKCDCGSIRSVLSANLRKGKSKSCGCLRNQIVSELFSTHKEAKSALYKRWCSMKERCSQVGNKIYHDRGISVCDDWKDYTTFRNWALANGYKEHLQLDRIDNEKGYSPENCRWVSRTQNQNNRRDNVKFTFCGVTMTLSEWSVKQNVPYKALWARLNKYRWSFEKAITTPVRQHKVYKLNTKEK
jgi:hypothetical protein